LENRHSGAFKPNTGASRQRDSTIRVGIIMYIMNAVSPENGDLLAVESHYRLLNTHTVNGAATHQTPGAINACRSAYPVHSSGEHMHTTSEGTHPHLADAGLLYLRVTGSVLVLLVHGLPKAMHYTSQAAAIEDPLHIGKTLTLCFAIFGEVFCPLLMIAGIGTRVAALPILLITLMALAVVHRDWTLEQGQFAWMLLIIFGTVAIAGAGRYRISALLGSRSSTRGTRR
jgi:putative oxidoreductase